MCRVTVKSSAMDGDGGNVECRDESSSAGKFAHPGLGRWVLVDSQIPGLANFRSGRSEINMVHAEENRGYEYRSTLKLQYYLSCLPCLSYTKVEEYYIRCTGEGTYEVLSSDGGISSKGRVLDGGKKYVENGRGQTTITYEGNRCITETVDARWSLHVRMEWERVANGTS